MADLHTLAFWWRGIAPLVYAPSMTGQGTNSPRPAGRPSIRTSAVEEEILGWIVEGKTLRAFCRQEGAPKWRTVYDWLEADAEFSARFARARELGHDAIAEETLHIADTPEEGVETVIKGDGVTEQRRGDMLGHRKLQIETRLKLLAKWNPKKYGERITQEHTGPGGGPMVAATISTDDPAEAARAYQELIRGS